MRPAFTLLELLLVLVVIGVLAAIAAARLGGMRATQGVEQAAQQVHDQALRCQALAARGGNAVRLRIDRQALTATVQELVAAGPQDPSDGAVPEVVLYDGVDTLTVTFVRDDGVAAADPLDLLFLPDGRCDTPGQLTLSNNTRDDAVQIHGNGLPPTLLLAKDLDQQAEQPQNGQTMQGGQANQQKAATPATAPKPTVKPGGKS